MAALEKKGHRFPAAALAGLLGYSRQAVAQWNGVIPEMYAYRVSLLSGVPMETILPETIAAVAANERPRARNNKNGTRREPA